MRLALLACLVAMGLTAAPEPGFEPLFNGKSLDGWEVDTPGLWTVRDGILTGKHAGLKYNDFLRTRRHYGDFVLKVEFRLVNGHGNSGIQFRSKPVPNSHEVSGYQADIGEKYWGCLYDESRRNKVLAGPEGGATEGVDKSGWNEYVLTAQGSRITLDLNGRRTVTYSEPDASIPRSGFIALQVHSGPGIEVQFRNIYVKELK